MVAGKTSFVPRSEIVGNAVEIIPDQLYFASFYSPPRSDAHVRYVNIDDRVHYEPFYWDFGPLNLAVLYRVTRYIHGLIDAPKKRKVVAYTNDLETNRVNGAYLMGAYMVIYHGMSADGAYLRLEAAQPPKFTGFRDAAMGEPTYLLHLHDVLRGIEKALRHKWLNFSNFDAEEYEYYERVENGDMNWIIPGRILSFCGPHNESKIEDGYPYHAPDTYFDYFRENNVSTIVRLNMRMYDANKFTEAGFEHVDLFFIDGSTPSDEIVEKFIHVVDNARGGVAVHCKAGLGRTGTLIACWMMKQYGLTAAECMSWLRVCRPGSVIGPQQQFLIEKQKFCWAMSRGSVVHIPKKPADKTCHKLSNKVDEIRLSKNVENARPRPAILPLRRPRRVSADKNGNPPQRSNVTVTFDETALDTEGRTQGDRLLVQKVRSQHHQPSSSSGCSTTRSVRGSNSTVPPSPFPVMDIRPVVVARMSAHTSSPRFSSPTTPIKPLASPTSGTLPKQRFASRNLASLIPPPISRVTVACGGGKYRGRPYPTQGLRVELAATGTAYELRRRHSPEPLQTNSTTKLVGLRRKKRST